ncbi:complement factor B-like [Anneissia japonica]|uniref:complement factor B-like n=1 Tax=Anneissia japonica TaxID=1529436 RepID=UPI001425BA13|nr:complement factor B-like [Anneissia japonica]
MVGAEERKCEEIAPLARWPETTLLKPCNGHCGQQAYHPPSPRISFPVVCPVLCNSLVFYYVSLHFNVIDPVTCFNVNSQRQHNFYSFLFIIIFLCISVGVPNINRNIFQQPSFIVFSVVRCSQLPILENGRKVGNDVNVGAIVKFFCSSGYGLEGPNQRECLEDGRWSRGDPVCIRKGNPSHCVPLPIPINGQKSGTRYDLYDVVIFTCESGYTLIGSKLRRCLETGWSGERTTCEGSDEYSDIEEVKDSFIQNFDALKTVTYTNPEVEARIEQEREAACNESAGENCQTGRLIDLNYEGRLEIYFVFDASQSVGQENFDISIDFAKAVVTKLGVGTKEKGPRYGFVVYSNDAEVVLHTTEPVDTVEAVHERLNTIEYEGRGTNTFAGLNALYVQVIPLSVNNLPPTDATPQRAVFLLTDGKSNTGGAPFDIANKLRAEFSAKIHCIGISESVNKDELVELASTPTREYYFHLKDYVSLEELAYAISNEEYDYSPCGIGGSNAQRSGRIIGGTDANPGAWPWQVAFYDNEQDDVFCGGTLISNEWILTAAHCFDQDPGPNSEMGKDWKTTTPYMGLTDREKDKKSSNTSRIIDLITHSLYNNKESPNYDYDVALAKIEPIRLHPQVRTVCLPGVTDTNLEEEYSLEGKLNKIEYVTVTGWGRLGFKKEKATKLQQLDLPLGIYDKCRESLDGAGDEFTHRMFCAGGEAGKDSCSGDSGGPVVQKRTNNGEERYEVVGIVSWGQADCGQEGEYGFYTHVPRLLDWIKKKTGLQ